MAAKINEELISKLIAQAAYDGTDLFSTVVWYCNENDIEPDSLIKEFDKTTIKRLETECIKSRRIIVKPNDENNVKFKSSSIDKFFK